MKTIKTHRITTAKNNKGESINFPLCPLTEWDTVMNHNGITPEPASTMIAAKAESLALTHLIYEPLTGLRKSVKNAVMDDGWKKPVLLGRTKKSAVYATIHAETEAQR